MASTMVRQVLQPLGVVGFQQRDAKSLAVAAEARERHHADARRAEQVVDKALVHFHALHDLLDVGLDFGIFDFKGLLGR
jgi:hypothetical protein